MRKLGEKILPEIIPILEEGLRSDKSDERQGVCIGLSEIMKSTSKDAVSQTDGHTCRNRRDDNFYCDGRSDMCLNFFLVL